MAPGQARSKPEPQEQHGLALAQQHCATGHVTELFTDNAYHNNGLNLDAAFGEGEAESRGRGRVTQRPEDAGRLKTPTLRNVAFTAPYIHDGRIAPLEEVLNHYRGGMVPSTTLDALLPFLHALTDERFLATEALSASP